MPSSSELADCLQLQREEVETLEAIYGPEVVSYTFSDVCDSPSFGCESDSSPTATLLIRMHIDLAEGEGGQPRAVRLLPRPTSVSGEPEASTSGLPSATSTFTLSHLPPLTLSIAYPPSYPSHTSPILSSVTAPSSLRYLDPTILTSTLPALLASTYADAAPDASLWTFLELMRTGEFLTSCTEVLAVPTDERTEDGIRRLRRELEDWDRGMKGEGFERTTFDCGICLEEKKGRKCLELEGCGHVFCRPCLTSCWTLAIEEGDVKSVACPSVDCVKKRATATGPTAAIELAVPDSAVELSLDEPPVVADFGSVVKDLLGDEAFDRWVRLTDKKRIESDPTYTFCPIDSCQAPVPAPPASESTGDRWSRYRACPSCSFSFCMFCRQTWHGVHTPCSLPFLPPFLLTYLDLPTNSPERLNLERRYGGRKVLEKMARDAVEDMSNKTWLQERTRECGGCGVRVEKSHGCNHMTCSHCGSHFCFRCSKSLPPTQPYKHYQIPGTPCFEQLFDAAEVAAFNRGVVALPGAEEARALPGAAAVEEEDDGEWEDPAGFERLGLGDGWREGGVDPLVGEFGGRAGRRRWEGM